MGSRVISVSSSPTHSFSKAVQAEIVLVAGLGVQGDAHAGALVRHRYHVRKDPTQPNLCQVHLLHAELFDELAEAGLAIQPGEMGENVTTRGLDLLALPVGTLLHLGADAVVELTGLRQPCSLMNKFRPGLMQACLGRDAQGRVVRRAGVMGVVRASGTVRGGDRIEAEMPIGQTRALGPV